MIYSWSIGLFLLNLLGPNPSVKYPQTVEPVTEERKKHRIYLCRVREKLRGKKMRF